MLFAVRDSASLLSLWVALAERCLMLYRTARRS